MGMYYIPEFFFFLSIWIWFIGVSWTFFNKEKKTHDGNTDKHTVLKLYFYNVSFSFQKAVIFSSAKMSSIL